MYQDYDPVVIPWRDGKHEAGFKAAVKRVYKVSLLSVTQNPVLTRLFACGACQIHFEGVCTQIREQQEEHKRLVKLRAEEKARREKEERERLAKLKVRNAPHSHT